MDADLHVFHGVDEPMGLPSPRYFLWAERLRHRPGAVRGAIDLDAADAREAAAHARTAAEAPPAAAQVSPGDGVRQLADERELVALTNQNGFAGFEYAGG